MVEINWHKIRPVGNSREKGFEELCAQLARQEAEAAGATFVRKGTPDAGVECFAILSDGSEWGWQAKYFSSFGPSQWKQLDQSVSRAIDRHPNLVRYIVCMPVDRPDARTEKQTSALEKWNQRVTKWKTWAAALGRQIEFEYWGNSELTARLSKERNAGLRWYFFDERFLSGEWFEARLQEAVTSAGPRYTPDAHVALDVARKFEAFGRTKEFFDELKRTGRAIRRALRGLTGPWDQVEEEVATGANELLARVKTFLGRLHALEHRPQDPLSFADLVETAEEAQRALAELRDLVMEKEATSTEEGSGRAEVPGESGVPSGRYFRQWRSWLGPLDRALGQALEALQEGQQHAEPKVLLLTGEAGIGKTHLLCDVAAKRVNQGLPTVLLLGQWFTSPADPWSQIRAKLQLENESLEKFVGALEAAAQSSGNRALLIIDALNEGEGRRIWPNHLAWFLATVNRSPWIGVVLSVRSGYERTVLPEGLPDALVRVHHEGFAGAEEDALRTFTQAYGLDLPSTPLLAPEYSNPLFLKILCEGLRKKGYRRIPRGYRGITVVFRLYLEAINDRLSQKLDFDPKDQLVAKAVERLAAAMLEEGKPWVTREKARALVDALLKREEFSRTLYANLVSQGVLLEEPRLAGDVREEVVRITYQRFADHLQAKSLLDKYKDAADFETAICDAGGLSFVTGKGGWASQGLLEALCVQMPERFGRELPNLLPRGEEPLGLAEAFRESIVWRFGDAITEETREVLNGFVRSDGDLYETVEVLLSVATVPGHRLNACFLDARLRQDAMPDRDSWWSTHLHYSWAWGGTVHRLVEWAAAVQPEMEMEEESLRLAATTLCWTFSTSNRFLRDRATKALVRLLTGRLAVMAELVERFSDVDDPYVAERVVAAAYGVAMHSRDAEAVGRLAQVVYNKVFAEGAPRPDILFRDYARGVVERALFLGASIEGDIGNIRPPYRSEWPGLPSEESVRPLLPKYLGGTGDTDAMTATAERIVSSVMEDDFGRYVIGANWRNTLDGWIEVTVNEPEWQGDPRSAPRINLEAIQRYAVLRVFGLGWTEERFGHFDERVGWGVNREGRKAERIGKKYQWIAYHEILALVSDRYQYLENLGAGEVVRKYEGPWVDHVRDIDPSFTACAREGGTALGGHREGWWAPVGYDHWPENGGMEDWLARDSDFPHIERVAIVGRPKDGSRWITGWGFLRWQEPVPADIEPTEVPRGDVWCMLSGYLIDANEADEFLVWAEKVDFFGRWMPEPQEFNRMFLGEHGWSPAAQYFRRPYFGDDGWVTPGQDCPAEVRTLAAEYLWEAHGVDCSLDETVSFRLPAVDLVEGLGIQWNGDGAQWVDVSGRMIAMDPTAHEPGPDALLLREDAVRQYLNQKGLTICWAVLGEKRVISGEFGRKPRLMPLRVSGALVLVDGGARGFMKYGSGRNDGPSRIRRIEAGS